MSKKFESAKRFEAERPSRRRALAHRVYALAWRFRGLRRLLTLLGPPVPQSKSLEVRVWGGAVMFAPTEGAGLAPALWQTGTYEELASDFLRRYAHSKVVYDVGANVGYYSVLAAASRASRVVAFEPFPANVQYLQANAALSGEGRITIIEAAAGESNGELKLHSGGEFGTGSLSATQAVSSELAAVVPVRRIDDVIAEMSLPLPDVIKIDVEGWESAVLTGMPHALAHEPVLIIEFNDKLLRGAGSSSERLHGQLADAGYTEFFDVGGRSARPFDVSLSFSVIAVSSRRASEVRRHLRVGP